MKVLFVTRDRKPGMIATRIAHALLAHNTEIAIVTEGLSMVEWREWYQTFPNSERKKISVVAQGPLDIKAPWDINPYEMLKTINPDVLVTGLSSPMRMEYEFSAAANRCACGRATPRVVLDDNWGAINRLPYLADAVLTIDELGARLVRTHSGYAQQNTIIEIIGDLSASAANEPIPQATIDAFNAAKGDAEYAFILASQKWPESEDIVEIGLASCALSLKAGAKLVVIPRFHPGAKQEDQTRWRDQVGLLIREYPDAVVNIDAAHSTDHLATLADGTFAANGSALRTAAYAGKMPLCVWTPRLGEKLKAESGMEHHPLITGGAGEEITEEIDIAEFARLDGERMRRAQRELLQPVPFDAVKAADAILAIAKK